MNKVTLLEESLFIMRSTQTHTDGRVEIWYYETPAMWNRSPMEATIFRTYEGGTSHLRMYSERDKAPKGWADGRKEVLEIVPLYGEILNSPNGKDFTIDRR